MTRIDPRMPPPRRLIPPGILETLSDALVTETQLINELTAVMVRQRAAVETDDLQRVDDSIFAVHRLLLTLGEARKRRRSVNVLLGQDAELAVQQLDDALGAQMTSRVRIAREALRTAARRLFAEIAINRRVLRDALAADPASHMSLL